eukprot:TRINITY_DN2486_c0_g1_i2.p1 TRINITY_DN2486_c0_g1~~TRINITY_DN2486_c0_g1_i2.p1  ORF type:complete len:184 (+),score=27.47 TRINITY_DN2486_c0_g1_i2:145-696(+)
MAAWDTDSCNENLTLSNWNTTVTQRQHELGTVLGQARVTHGRRYFEVTLNVVRGVFMIGWAIEDATLSNGAGCHSGSWAIDQLGNKGTENAWQHYGSKIRPGMVIGCGLDLVDRTITFFVNGKCLGVAYSGLPSGVAFRPVMSLKHKGTQATAKFDVNNDDFTFPPADELGFSAVYAPEETVL